jgi:hypothetical protein
VLSGRRFYLAVPFSVSVLERWGIFLLAPYGDGASAAIGIDGVCDVKPNAAY